MIIKKGDYMGNNKNNLVGKEFGRLTVVKDTGKRDISRQKIWLCKCECGRSIETSTGCLHRGESKSCGCLKIEAANKAQKKRTLTNGSCVESFNAKLQKNNTSGHVGVTKSRNGLRWRSQIMYKHKGYCIGTYDTIDQAIEARKEAESHLFVDFEEWFNNRKK